MKIVSKFRDYYDSIQGYGFDDTVLFIRKKKEIYYRNKGYRLSPKEEKKDFFYDTFKIWEDLWDMPKFERLGIVYFCGKEYPFVEIANGFIFYSFEKADNYITSILNKKEILEYLKKGWYYKKGSYQEELKKFFEKEKKPYERIVEKHAELETPIFLFHRYSRKDSYIILNPILRNFSFQNAVDPYTTYQELDMFLSGVMQSKENPMVTISDEDQKFKKGFDDMSFKPKMRLKNNG